MRVLIADDHPIMLSGVEAILQGTVYEVVDKLIDGSQVLESIARTRPDILLLDVQMPGRTGMDVLRTLRSRGDKRPVVLLTAHLDDHDLLGAIQIGVQGILLKDGAQGQLISCLDAVCAGGRWIEQSLMERALNLSLSGGAASDPLTELTAKEKAIVGLVAQGLRNRNIAAELGITEGTVKVYLHRIYEKLGVSSRVELAIATREKTSGTVR
jgi:two-component system nitrate/nitrite response regulator NarP